MDQFDFFGEFHLSCYRKRIKNFVERENENFSDFAWNLCWRFSFHEKLAILNWFLRMQMEDIDKKSKKNQLNGICQIHKNKCKQTGYKNDRVAWKMVTDKIWWVFMKITRQQKSYISLPRHEEISENLKTSVKLKVQYGRIDVLSKFGHFWESYYFNLSSYEGMNPHLFNCAPMFAFI